MSEKAEFELGKIEFEACINPTKQGFKMSGDGSGMIVLELDATNAINYAAFYAYACNNPGPLEVTINLTQGKIYK